MWCSSTSWSSDALSGTSRPASGGSAGAAAGRRVSGGLRWGEEGRRGSRIPTKGEAREEAIDGSDEEMEPSRQCEAQVGGSTRRRGCKGAGSELPRWDCFTQPHNEADSERKAGNHLRLLPRRAYLRLRLRRRGRLRRCPSSHPPPTRVSQARHPRSPAGAAVLWSCGRVRTSELTSQTELANGKTTNTRAIAHPRATSEARGSNEPHPTLLDGNCMQAITQTWANR